MFRVAICEDCPDQAKIILNMLNSYQADRPDIEMQIHSFACGDEILSVLDAGRAFDLFLLDILMPEQNGIELARQIRARDSDVPIVFLTISADYALDAFSVSAFQYILKPVNKDLLFPVLDKITSALKYNDERFFMLAAPERTIKVPFASIVCVELSGRALRIYQDNGNTLLSKTIRSRFEAIVSPLLEDSRFLCPHKSFVINMAWIDELTGTSFVMNNDVHVPIPRYKYAEVKARYFAWLSERGIGIIGGK